MELSTYWLTVHLETHPAEKAVGEVNGAGRGQWVAARIEAGVPVALEAEDELREKGVARRRSHEGVGHCLVPVSEGRTVASG